jgi:hypothetical protein
VFSPTTEEEWMPPWATPEWLEWWKSLDHTMCTQAGYSPESDVPAYIRCMSMHCPTCNRTTGGQGHFDCKLERLSGIPYPS